MRSLESGLIPLVLWQGRHTGLVVPEVVSALGEVEGGLSLAVIGKMVLAGIATMLAEMLISQYIYMNINLG